MNWLLDKCTNRYSLICSNCTPTSFSHHCTSLMHNKTEKVHRSILHRLMCACLFAVSFLNLRNSKFFGAEVPSVMCDGVKALGPYLLWCAIMLCSGLPSPHQTHQAEGAKIWQKPWGTVEQLWSLWGITLSSLCLARLQFPLTLPLWYSLRLAGLTLVGRIEIFWLLA